MSEAGHPITTYRRALIVKQKTDLIADKIAPVEVLNEALDFLAYEAALTAAQSRIAELELENADLKAQNENQFNFVESVNAENVSLKADTAELEAREKEMKELLKQAYIFDPQPFRRHVLEWLENDLTDEERKRADAALKGETSE